MSCQICNKPSSFYPLCKEHFVLRDQGKITKCQECGIWKDDTKPLCYECWLKNKKVAEKKLPSYKPTEHENEEKSFRDKFPASYRTEDGHKVRSRAELTIGYIIKELFILMREKFLLMKKSIVIFSFLLDKKYGLNFGVQTK